GALRRAERQCRMAFRWASTHHGTGLAMAGLTLAVVVTGVGAGTTRAAPGTGPLTISSPAFANNAPIPPDFTCKGADVSPPLAWSAPLGAALVVDDPDAVNGLFVHLMVAGNAPRSGSAGDGARPAGGA